MLVTLWSVVCNELFHLGVDRRLEHVLGSKANDFIQWTPLVKLGSELKYLCIHGFSDWNFRLRCGSFAHGVFLVPSLGR